MEPKAVQEPELKSHRVNMNALYSKAFMQSKTGDHYVALKTLNGTLGVTPEDPDLFKLNTEVSLRVGNPQTAASVALPIIASNHDYADAHRIIGYARSASDNLHGVLKKLEAVVSPGADDIEVQRSEERCTRGLALWTTLPSTILPRFLGTRLGWTWRISWLA